MIPERESESMMSLRHIKPGITAARNAGTGIFHPTLRHPHTGEPLEAVGVVGDEVLWPILGGAPDEGGDDEEGDEDPDGDEGSEEGEDDDPEGDEDDGDGEDGKRGKSGAKAKIAALTEEKDRHFKRRKKAEAERDALKAELEALKRGKKAKPKADDQTDDEESEEDDEKAELRKELAELREQTKTNNIERAFESVTSNAKIDWIKPGQIMALFMADDDFELEFDDRGNVDRKSLTAELKRFAKANPHLVKPKPKQDDGDDDQQGQRSSGSSMNGQRKGKGKQAPTREALAKKYPALGNR